MAHLAGRSVWTGMNQHCGQPPNTFDSTMPVVELVLPLLLFYLASRLPRSDWELDVFGWLPVAQSPHIATTVPPHPTAIASLKSAIERRIQREAR